MLLVFRGAFWGSAILAPLDIGPTLYSKYKWIDPNLGNIPRNHRLIDVFDYDLPRCYLAYQTLQLGEFPWWEPFSDGGGPLLAEAHSGIPDPLRLFLFHIFSFATAFNWTRILQSFLAGLGMFLLLRSFKFSQFITVLGGLSFQFSGLHASTFYPHGLLYYPYLWLALATFSCNRPTLAVGLGGPLCAAVMMAGTQQSHVFLVLFLLCFVAGYVSSSRQNAFTICLSAGGAFALGCALAAPILIAQVEVFFLSTRRLSGDLFGLHLLTGVFSLSSIFPWFTGSSRSLDLGKLLEQQGATYALYLGTPMMILALVGLFAVRNSPRLAQPGIRTSLLLVFLYFVLICSTPAIKWLYNRSAGLGVLGLTILSAVGFELLLANARTSSQKIVRLAVLLIGIGVLLTHAFAFLIYPRVKDTLVSMALDMDAQNIAMPRSPELRRFQVDNLPNEITFRNPEPLLAMLGALCLLGFATRDANSLRILSTGVFVLNLAPLLIFSNRFTAYSPMEYWEALISGGPEQKAVASVVGRDLRLAEDESCRLDRVFPSLMMCFHQVHSLTAYRSLSLLGPGQASVPRDYNVFYRPEPDSNKGEAALLHTNSVRFVWSDGLMRPLFITRETPNSIHLHIDAGEPGELVRTDTYYPGWRVQSPNSVVQSRNEDGFFCFKIPSEAIDLVLRYEPSYSEFTKTASLTALALTGILLVSSARPRRTDPLPPAN